MPKPLKTKVTIEMAIMSFETDYQGIVNNTEFIRFLERVRYALSKKLGFSFKQVRNAKLWTVMAHVEINYYTPGRFEDIMLGTGWVEKVGHTSLTLGYEFRLKGGEAPHRGRQTSGGLCEYRPEAHGDPGAPAEKTVTLP